MQRRSLVLAAAAIAAGAAGDQPHTGPHHTLPVAPSSLDPYAKLQGGVPHHMTPEQESQRVADSPAPAGPRGRWVARAALPIPCSEMAWATAAMGRMHVLGGYGEGAVNRDYHHISTRRRIAGSMVRRCRVAPTMWPSRPGAGGCLR